MSRVGNSPIVIDDKINVTINSDKNDITVKGPKGELNLEYNSLIIVKLEDKHIVLERANEHRKTKALHGLYRALIANMVTGVTTGFSKTLEINGVGYKVQKKGKGLNFSLGYSHQIEYPETPGIEFVVESDTKLKIEGIDKAKVGQVAAEIREFRPPEPYKGKGIKYSDEVIKRKAGKAGK